MMLSEERRSDEEEEREGWGPYKRIYIDVKWRVSKMFVQLRFRRTKPGPKPDSRNIRLAAVVILRPSRTLPNEEARKK